MYFVLEQIREGGHTYDHNVRMGGYKHRSNAVAAAVKRSAMTGPQGSHDRPYIVKDHTRRVVGMATNGSFVNV